MMHRIFVFSLAVLACTGCSSGQQNSANATAPPAPALKNVIGFPLYPGATIVSARSFTQNVHVDTSTVPSVFGSGSGTYSGREVLASSGASFGDLSNWVSHLSVSPPPGYTSVETGNNPNQRTQAKNNGVDYAAFQKKDGSKTRGLLVIVMDPQIVNERFGRILGMIGKYRALPAVMRAPIDDEAKARIGMTITEATQPDSPIGTALDALDQFQHKNARGIVIIDAVKH